jgi:hypothetical protein
MHDCAALACGLPVCDRKCTLDNVHAFELHYTDEDSKLVMDNDKRVHPSYLAKMSNEKLEYYFSGTDSAEVAIPVETDKCALLCCNCRMLITYRDQQHFANDSSSDSEDYSNVLKSVKESISTPLHL